MPNIDTSNLFFVSAQGQFLRIMNPAIGRITLTKREALNLAAYLVSMSEAIDDEDGPSFEEVLEAIRKT